MIRQGRPIKRRGGSRFPRRRDPKFMAWMVEQIRRGVWCDACGRQRASARAHLDAKGSGGFDRGNTVLLCDGPEGCHRLQEKRTAAFCRERGVDLQAQANAWATAYANRTEVSWCTT